MVECALNSYGIRMGKLQLAVNAIRNPQSACGIVRLCAWRGMRYKTPVSRQHASKPRAQTKLEARRRRRRSVTRLKMKYSRVKLAG